jgi:hypothetical protein
MTPERRGRCAGEFFVCLKRCLDDFNGHNIDTACELVVAAGAFMMRQADTRERMESMLGVRRSCISFHVT